MYAWVSIYRCLCIWQYTHKYSVFLCMSKSFKKYSPDLYLMRDYIVREGCQRGTCPLSSSGCGKLCQKTSIHKQLLGVFCVVAGGAAGLYTCQIHLAANFESHPLLKSPLLLLCINDFLAVYTEALLSSC